MNRPGLMRNWLGSGRILGVLILLAAVLCPSWSGAQEPPRFKLTKTDKCPVCGMFVAKYPDFVAQITFKDGSYAVFDGVKDMMKYYFGLAKYNPSKKEGDIAEILVTDYYSIKPIDGLKAYYVLGSDVYGPMGKELIPFQTEAEASEFLQDHAGKKLLQFPAISPELIKSLD